MSTLIHGDPPGPRADASLEDEGFDAFAGGGWDAAAGPRLSITEKAGTQKTGQWVLLAVRAHPGLRIRDLAGLLGISATLTHYHVRTLAGLGRVLLARPRGALQVYPVQAGGRRGRRSRRGLFAVTRPLPMAAITALWSRNRGPPAVDLQEVPERSASRPLASEAVSP